jgi:hypothetical protein
LEWQREGACAAYLLKFYEEEYAAVLYRYYVSLNCLSMRIVILLFYPLLSRPRTAGVAGGSPSSRPSRNFQTQKDVKGKGRNAPFATTVFMTSGVVVKHSTVAMRQHEQRGMVVLSCSTRTLHS